MADFGSGMSCHKKGLKHLRSAICADRIGRVPGNSLALRNGRGFPLGEPNAVEFLFYMLLFPFMLSGIRTSFYRLSASHHGLSIHRCSLAMGLSTVADATQPSHRHNQG